MPSCLLHIGMFVLLPGVKFWLLSISALLHVAVFVLLHVVTFVLLHILMFLIYTFVSLLFHFVLLLYVVFWWCNLLLHVAVFVFLYVWVCVSTLCSVCIITCQYLYNYKLQCLLQVVGFVILSVSVFLSYMLLLLLWRLSVFCFNMMQFVLLRVSLFLLLHDAVSVTGWLG